VKDVTRLQALVDKKKVIIIEATIRDALRLDDAKSIDCLPNEKIFTEISRMGIVRNMDSSTKFYMYVRFLQLMIRAQVGDLSSHSTKYSSPALTQKQANDVADKGAADVDAVPAAIDEPFIPSPTPTTQPPPPSQDLPSTSQNVAAVAKDVAAEKDAEIEKNADIQGRQAESQAQIYQIDLEHDDKVLSMQDDELEPAELKEVVEVVTTTKLMTEVVTAASATITAADTLITAAPSTARRRK
nr:hypothetical protein [Tanacetum cinerariifolium]